MIQVFMALTKWFPALNFLMKIYLVGTWVCCSTLTVQFFALFSMHSLIMANSERFFSADTRHLLKFLMVN